MVIGVFIGLISDRLQNNQLVCSLGCCAWMGSILKGFFSFDGEIMPRSKLHSRLLIIQLTPPTLMGSLEKSRPIYLGTEEFRFISDRVTSLVGDCSRVVTCTCRVHMWRTTRVWFFRIGFEFMKCWSLTSGQKLSRVFRHPQPATPAWIVMKFSDDALYFVDSGWCYYVGMHLPVLQLGYCSLYRQRSNKWSARTLISVRAALSRRLGRLCTICTCTSTVGVFKADETRGRTSSRGTHPVRRYAAG